MNITITKDLLSTAMHRVQGAISDRALSQVGLRASSNEGQLRVAATDRY